MGYPTHARSVDSTVSSLFQLFTVFQRIFREALVWRRLDHPFVLPFIGIHVRTSDRIGMVAPWRERGTLKAYTKSEFYCPEVDLYRLVSDLCSRTHACRHLSVPCADDGGC
jgi:hypothetical protein